MASVCHDDGLPAARQGMQHSLHSTHPQAHTYYTQAPFGAAYLAEATAAAAAAAATGARRI
jgi:hypothetical protein